MISKIQNLGSHLLSTDIKAKMIDDDLYYILLDEVQLVPKFEALPKISENTQIFLAEILENTQIFLAEILENTQIFYNDCSSFTNLLLKMVSLLRINEGNVIFCRKSLKKHNYGRL